jgi:hypothetical protein
VRANKSCSNYTIALASTNDRRMGTNKRGMRYCHCAFFKKIAVQKFIVLGAIVIAAMFALCAP